jgi:hypothetical protein
VTRVGSQRHSKKEGGEKKKPAAAAASLTYNCCTEFVVEK